MTRFFPTAAIPLAAILLTAGCGHEVKKTLGLERNQPDEFAVAERAPLTLPPHYDLVPPQPGAARPQETAPVNTARGLILRSESDAPKAVAGRSASESALLNKAGAAKADSNIRSELMREKNVNAEQSQPVVEKLGLRKGSAPGKALNAEEEAKRLAAQKAAAGK